jgi:hypothetical protein
MYRQVKSEVYSCIAHGGDNFHGDGLIKINRNAATTEAG